MNNFCVKNTAAVFHTARHDTDLHLLRISSYSLRLSARYRPDILNQCDFTRVLVSCRYHVSQCENGILFRVAMELDCFLYIF